MINHKGEGSLSSILKDKSWINFLSFWHDDFARDINFFKINIQLTDEGLLHTDEIITLIFQYFNLIKKMDPEKWIFAVSSCIF